MQNGNLEDLNSVFACTNGFHGYDKSDPLKPNSDASGGLGITFGRPYSQAFISQLYVSNSGSFDVGKKNFHVFIRRSNGAGSWSNWIRFASSEIVKDSLSISTYKSTVISLSANSTGTVTYTFNNSDYTPLAIVGWSDLSSNIRITNLYMNNTVATAGLKNEGSTTISSVYLYFKLLLVKK